MAVSLDEDRVKELLKEAMTELLEEHKDYFYDLFVQVIEDAALANAIRDGENSEPVDAAEIFDVLDEQS